MATSPEPSFVRSSTITKHSIQLTPNQHLFSQLPPELRLRIWALNLPTSRLIPINCLTTLTPPSSSKSSLTSFASSPPGCTSTASIPANLHAVSESRLHALTTHYDHALSFARAQPALIIDFRADVVYFPPLPGYMASASNFHTCLTLCSPGDLSRIERLALHEDVLSTGTGEDWYYSGLAVERTMEVLRLVRERLTGTGECVFVARRAPGRVDRLREQVRTAMADIGWEGGLTWSVVEEP